MSDSSSYPTTPIQWCGEPHPHGPHRYGRGVMAWYTDYPGSACRCVSSDGGVPVAVDPTTPEDGKR